MTNGVPIAIAALDTAAAVVQCATALLDGKPETEPDLKRLLAGILSLLASLRGA